MGQQAHRLGDLNTASAAISSVPSNSDVFCNSKLLSVNGSPVVPHGAALHGAPFTANGSSTVFCHSIPVNSKTDADNCGHTRATGSTNVFIGG